MEKQYYGKIRVNLLQPPDYTGNMENIGPFQKLWKKKLRSHPGNFEPLRGRP
jgi:hypothetical protein